MPDAEQLRFLEAMLELTNMQNIFSQQGGWILYGRLKRLFWGIVVISPLNRAWVQMWLK